MSARTAAAFTRLEQTWRKVLSHSAVPSAFHSWEFAHEWWRHFVLGRVGGATGQYEVVVVSTADGLPVAVLPFYVESAMGRRSLGTTLQPFGRSSSFETMTDSPVAIYRVGFEARALEAVKSYLAGQRRDWDIAAVRANPSDTSVASPSPRFAGTAPVVEVTRVCEAPLIAPLSASWAAYRATLSKSMRDNVAYYPRKLTRERPRWSLREVRLPAEIGAATATLIRLHRMRSAAATGVPHYNHIQTAGQAEFLHRWFKRAAERNQVGIWLLEIDGQVAAAQVFLDSPASVAIYYSGYDERYYRYSPLTIITAEAIRAGIERGVRRLEFPPSVTAWKARWGVQECGGIAETSIYSIHPRALARGMLRRLYFRTMPQHLDNTASVQVYDRR
ncbi:MAG TPA: GNAT family N-acetyltransferase [Polyangia bacterium]|nr:GNAT family N-acetyltransferase [Polyangia bacterium]